RPRPTQCAGGCRRRRWAGRQHRRSHAAPRCGRSRSSWQTPRAQDRQSPLLGRIVVVDWCCDTRIVGAARRLEHEVLAHLARHAMDPRTVELAVPLVAGTLEEACRNEAGVCWVALEWDRDQPELAVRWLPQGPWPPPGFLAPGFV